MKLNIKKIAPFLVAGALVLGGCQSANGQSIEDKNFDESSSITIEESTFDESSSTSIEESTFDDDVATAEGVSVEDYYDFERDDWKELFSDNIEGSIYGVAKTLDLNEEEAADYLQALTGSTISFEACKDFYIYRFECNEDSIGTLVTYDTLYIDHNVVSTVYSHLDDSSIIDGESHYIPVIDLLEQGVEPEAISKDYAIVQTNVHTPIYQDKKVTINSTDFTTEYETFDHLDKDNFFGELMNYPGFENSFLGHEDMEQAINSYKDDDEYVVYRRVSCGPDGGIAKEVTRYFCNSELLLGHTGDYNRLVYLPADNEYAYLDDVSKINDYLRRTGDSNEQLFTIQEAPGYTEEYSGKYGTPVEKGYVKTIDHK